MTDSKLAKLAATAVKECIGGADHEPADAQLSCAYKGKLEFAIAAGIEAMERQPKRAGGSRANSVHQSARQRIARVDERRNQSL